MRSPLAPDSPCTAWYVFPRRAPLSLKEPPPVVAAGPDRDLVRRGPSAVDVARQRAGGLRARSARSLGPCTRGSRAVGASARTSHDRGAREAVAPEGRSLSAERECQCCGAVADLTR
jgi:hypothetical protein